MEGFDSIGLQELGGFSHLSLPWTIADIELDGHWGFYVTNPTLAHRAIATRPKPALTLAVACEHVTR